MVSIEASTNIYTYALRNMVETRVIRQAYTKLLQVLTKQEEGDMQPAKSSDSQNCTKQLPGVDTKHVQKYVEL
jgi:hypothetical protein